MPVILWRRSRSALLPILFIGLVADAAWAAEGEHPGRPIAYLLQQGLNATLVSSFYALLAVSYTLVYGITNRVVLMFGDFAAFGAFYAVLAMIAITALTQLATVAALLGVVLISLAGTAALGYATQRAVIKPLLGRPSQALLIATIGLAILLQESLRLASGGREQWLPPILSDAYRLWEAGGFIVQITEMQIVILVGALALSFGLLVFVRYSRFGKFWRACSQDRELAALCGINVSATIAWTFVIASAYAAIAGYIIAVYYGGVSFHMGTVLGLKALFAAIVGGLGSVGGALLGGFVLGSLETVWSAYFDLEYRDVAVFGLFLLVLILRPQGLLGMAERRTNDF